MLEEIKNVNSEFYRLKNMQSDIDGLNMAQVEILKLLKKGLSINQIAKHFNVHFATIKRQMSSTAFISALADANNATNEITLEECRQRLMRIVRESKNENSIIKSVAQLCNMQKLITVNELAKLVGDSTDTEKEKSVEVLKRLGIIEEVTE